MLAARATMLQDVGIVAAGLFQRVAENRHALEGPPVVDSLGEGDDVGGAPNRIDGHGTERVAENVTEESSLPGSIGSRESPSDRRCSTRGDTIANEGIGRC